MATTKTISPAFQFYPKDFLSSSKVGRMSMTERGVYITLLSHCWLDLGLPYDVAQLARLAGMKQPQFAKMWAGPLCECFIEKDGRLTNPRLEKERKAQADYRKKMKGAATTRWEKHRNAKAMPGNAQALHDMHKEGNALRSPISYPQSASTASAVARAPLHVPHHKHAACGRVCVPASLHGEFVRRRNHPEADNELREWYLAVDRQWCEPPLSEQEPGDSFDFWKARYAEKWPAKVAVKDARPTWAQGL